MHFSVSLAVSFNILNHKSGDKMLVLNIPFVVTFKTCSANNGLVALGYLKLLVRFK